MHHRFTGNNPVNALPQPALQEHTQLHKIQLTMHSLCRGLEAAEQQLNWRQKQLKPFRPDVFQSYIPASYLSKLWIEQTIDEINAYDKALFNYQTYYFPVAGPALEQLKNLINQYVIWTTGNSLNLLYDASDLFGKFTGMDIDYMARTFAERVDQYEKHIRLYNDYFQRYRLLKSRLKEALNTCTGVELDYQEHTRIEKLQINPHSGASLAMALLAGKPHLNNHTAVSDFVLYEIKLDGETWKFGIADMKRLTSEGEPVRLMQQVSKLKRMFPDLAVTYEKTKVMINVTKVYAKRIEDEHIIRVIAAHMKWIPDGNPAHWRKYTEFLRRGLHLETIKLMQRFGKYLL